MTGFLAPNTKKPNVVLFHFTKQITAAFIITIIIIIINFSL